VGIGEKDKRIKSQVQSAFLKTETIWQELVLEDVIGTYFIKGN
jgi:hypothetical protein